MSAPNGGVPAGGVSGGGGLAAHAKRTEAQWKASLYGQVNDRYNGVKLFGSDFNLLGNQVGRTTSSSRHRVSRSPISRTSSGRGPPRRSGRLQGAMTSCPFRTR
ncbi:hypothetical protein GS415_08765 [Rhodococcus hoagii]|nr:hypothetical protein [Prescottella equi]